MLPEDVILDILVRLPSKCLCRFRCVSKHWNTLLSGPSFLKAHLHRSLRLRHLLLRYDVNSVSKLGVRYSGHHEFSDLDLPNDFRSLSLVDSFNGIVCMSTNLLDLQAASIIITLCNPATRECITVPEPPSPKPKHFVVGFGFNPLDGHLDDFKVIAINIYRYPRDDHDQQPKYFTRVDVYSLRTNSWKELGDCFSSWHPGRMGDQVILKEFICWCPWIRMNDRFHMAIVSFDVVNEEFSETALPDSIPKSSFSFIALLDGCVSLLATADNSKGYEVWTMKEFGTAESWTKLYNIDLRMGGFERYRPLGFARANEALFVSSMFLGLRIWTPTYVFSYDTEKMMHSEDGLNLMIEPSSRTRMAIYVESMISLSNYISRLENP